MNNEKPTRGSGRLEYFLAKQRFKQADKKFDLNIKEGAILDIGCGNYPYFLTIIQFKEKFGIDKITRFEQNNDKLAGIKLLSQDFINNPNFALQENYFSAVTALAVFEHLDNSTTIKIMTEACRVLKPEGKFVITVPRDIADKILKLMAALKLVSSEEINEHQQMYTKRLLQNQLAQAGFRKIEIN